MQANAKVSSRKIRASIPIEVALDNMKKVAVLYLAHKTNNLIAITLVELDLSGASKNE